MGILLALSSLPVLGQSDVQLHPDRFDHRLLVHFLWAELNAHRDRNRCGPLGFDSVLAELAARDFQRGVGRQPLSVLPSASAGSYQNVQVLGGALPLEHPFQSFRPIRMFLHRVQSYRQAAVRLLNGAESSGLYTDRSLTQVGIVLALDSLGGEMKFRLIAARSTTPIGGPLAAPETNKLAFDWGNDPNDLPFRLATRANRNLQFAQEWWKNTGFDGWITTTRPAIRRAFRWYHARTWLVPEYQRAEYFESEAQYLRQPSRTNQRYLLNGAMGRKIKRREITRLTKQAEPKYLAIFGWTTPIKIWPRTVHLQLTDNLSTGMSANFLMVRKGRLCDIRKLVPRPGASLSPAFPEIPHQLVFQPGLPDTLRQTLRDSVRYRIFYARNQVEIQESEQQQLLACIPDDYRVRKIVIRSFASIEGSAEPNRQLFDARASRVRSLLIENGLLVDSAEVVLERRENWPRMDAQLRAEGAARKLPDIRAREAVRAYINKHRSDTLVNRWLNEQRYSDITLLLTREERSAETAPEILDQFRQLANKAKLTADELRQLIRLQKRYYQVLVATNQVASNALELPRPMPFSYLEFQQRQFSFLFEGGDPEDFHTYVQALAASRLVTAALREQSLFHHQIFLSSALFRIRSLPMLRTDWNCAPEKQQMVYLTMPRKHEHRFTERPTEVEALDLLRPLITRFQARPSLATLAKDLEFYYLVHKSQGLMQARKYQYIREARNLANRVWIRHLHERARTADDSVSFAYYFSSMHEPDYARALLRPLAQRSRPHPEALKGWISLSFDPQDERATERRVLAAERVLATEEWQELVSSGLYLPVDILARIRIRERWQNLLEWEDVFEE
jgi:hypothetical protein